MALGGFRCVAVIRSSSWQRYVVVYVGQLAIHYRRRRERGGVQGRGGRRGVGWEGDTFVSRGERKREGRAGWAGECVWQSGMGASRIAGAWGMMGCVGRVGRVDLSPSERLSTVHSARFFLLPSPSSSTGSGQPVFPTLNPPPSSPGTWPPACALLGLLDCAGPTRLLSSLGRLDVWLSFGSLDTS